MTMGIRPRPTYQKTRDNRRIHLNRDKLPARATYHFSRDEALVDIGDTGIAIPPLIAALTDVEAHVRVAACEALRSLTPEAVMAGSHK